MDVVVDGDDKTATGALATEEAGELPVMDGDGAGELTAGGITGDGLPAGVGDAVEGPAVSC